MREGVRQRILRTRRRTYARMRQRIFIVPIRWLAIFSFKWCRCVEYIEVTEARLQYKYQRMACRISGPHPLEMETEIVSTF